MAGETAVPGSDAALAEALKINAGLEERIRAQERYITALSEKLVHSKAMLVELEHQVARLGQQRSLKPCGTEWVISGPSLTEVVECDRVVLGLMEWVVEAGVDSVRELVRADAGGWEDSPRSVAERLDFSGALSSARSFDYPVAIGSAGLQFERAVPYVVDDQADAVLSLFPSELASHERLLAGEVWDGPCEAGDWERSMEGDSAELGLSAAWLSDAGASPSDFGIVHAGLVGEWIPVQDDDGGPCVKLTGGLRTVFLGASAAVAASASAPEKDLSVEDLGSWGDASDQQSLALGSVASWVASPWDGQNVPLSQSDGQVHESVE